MTTICTDGRTVAADGKSCLGDRPVSLRTQKIVVSNGTLYALSGPECMIRPIIEWWERGHDHATVPVAKDEGCAWTLMVIDPGGTVIMTSRCQFPSPIPSGVFAIGSGMAAASGVLFAPFGGVDATMGLNWILRAFIVVVVGGMGSLAGSVAAAILVSLLEAYASLWVSPSQAVIVSFVVLILTLLWRPTGLFVATPK